MTGNNNLNIGGYDMAISVTQSDINAQLSRLRGHGRIDTKIDQTFSDGTSLTAILDAPTVLFKANPDQKNQRVFLVLHLASGTFTALDNKQIKIEKWKVAVKVVLKINPISPEEIKNHKGIPDEVKEKLQQFDEINYKVQQLYIDFKSSSWAVDIDRSLSTTPGMPDKDYQSLGKLLDAHLRGFSGAHNPYNLGYVPTSTDTESFKADPDKSRFEPTGVSFSITDNGRLNESTLNYMLMTNHREFPTGELSGIIRFNLIKGSLMRLSQRAFIEDFILARIQTELNMPGFSGTNPWSTQRETKKPEQKYQFSGNVEAWMRFEEVYPCRVNFTSGSRPGIGRCGIIEVGGTVNRKVWYRYRQGDQDQVLTGALRWFIELNVPVAENGRLFIKRNKPEWNIAFDPETNQWFENIARDGSQGAKEQAEMVYGYLRNYLSEFLEMLRILFRPFENILVLPAGDAFYFKDPDFKREYAATNLVLTLSYANL
jgi:hypothetical protein